MIVFVVSFQAFANPQDEPTTRFLERWSRAEPVDLIHGSTLRDPLTWAYRYQRFGLPSVDAGLSPSELVETELEVELDQARGCEACATWSLRPEGTLSLGDGTPPYNGGDPEAGLASVRAGAVWRFYPSVFELLADPSAGLDWQPGSVDLGFQAREAWVGVHSAAVTAGFGLRNRWLGPARHGSLLLSDHAAPAPLASASWEGRPFGSLGRVHVEGGAGWLQRPRSDVRHPGWLLFDLRWLLRPEVELGLSRTSLFGGADRPLPSVGQLLLPTEPHVTDDPDRSEPDQDELASLDFRVLLPIGRWLGTPSDARAMHGLDYVELYWEYGGEDVIAREALGVPYPSLAGVANMLGGEVASGPLTLTVEHARLLDDRFRWYTGHRVYHEGFTQDGESMGMASGGDALTTWAAIAWFPVSWGAEISFEHVLCVGVVDAIDGGIQALATDEVRDRVGLSGWRHAQTRGWWRLEAVVERGTGIDFVPGREGWTWYFAVSR